MVGVLLAIASLATSFYLRPVEDLLAKAEQAFHQGVVSDLDESRRFYIQAAGQFEELRQRGIANPDLYRNQGNAYLLAGDLPRAIVAYHRGLRLSPNDEELRANLTYCRDQVVYPASGNLGRPPVDHWPPWLPRPTMGSLFFVTLIAYSLFWIGITAWWATRRNELMTLAVIALVVSLLGGAGLMWLDRESRHDHDHPLVVIAKDGVLLRRGNGLSYPTVAEQPLNQGVEARLRFYKGDWIQIELAGGEVGWMPGKAGIIDAL